MRKGMRTEIKRKTKKTIITKVLCLAVSSVMVLGLLAGCKNEAEQERESDNIAAADREHEPITIVTAGRNYAQFAELLAEAYPEVNLEFISYAGRNPSDYLRTTLEVGQIPDIYSSTTAVSAELQKEYLLDLSGYDLINAYAPTMLNAMDVDGAVYMLPSSYSLTGIAYNKTILEENNWEVPHSFEELLELAPKIEAAGYEVANMNTRLQGITLDTFFGLGNTNYFYTPEGNEWKSNFLTGTATAVGNLEPVAEYIQKWIDAGFINNYYHEHRDLSCNKDFKSRKFVFRINMSPVTGDEGGDEFGFLPYLSEDGSNNMLVRQISRYYGLNKELGKAGNEQKLEDAIKVLTLMDTEEGQTALSGGDTLMLAPLKLTEIPEDSVYTEVAEYINGGYIMDLSNTDWKDYAVPIIERYGTDWIDGNITGKDFLEGMDFINEEILVNGNADKIVTVSEDLSQEDTARLVAIAMGKAADTDAALITMGAFHGFLNGANNENRSGINSGIFQGDILSAELTIFTDNTANILTIEMTGRELKDLAEAGADLNGDGNPFEYCMLVKGGNELEDEKTYQVAVSSNELSDAAMLEAVSENGISLLNAVTDYLTALGTVTVKDIIWE